MITSNITQSITIVSLFVLLSACASNAPVPRLATGESIAVHQPVIKRVDSAVDSKTTRAGKGAALGVVGAVGGAALGSSMGGLLGFACGPAAIICVPVGLAAGAAIGGVGGGVLGIAAGGRGGISGDKADRFNEIASGLMDEASLATQLHDQFSATARQYWVLRDDSANTVLLKVNSLQFKQPGDEDIQLVVNAEMQVEFGGPVETVEVEHVGARRHVDYWVDGEGDNFRSEIDLALHAVAQKMVDRMVDHGRIAQR
ncbi:MAG: hypothetical protein E2O54_16450 [Gammaproteobacteria bacterium]|nr:MAG: hypothetical protein E2O54_16450 [Gammaproteobacteria bacterium]